MLQCMVRGSQAGQCGTALWHRRAARLMLDRNQGVKEGAENEMQLQWTCTWSHWTLPPDWRPAANPIIHSSSKPLPMRTWGFGHLIDLNRNSTSTPREHVPQILTELLRDRLRNQLCYRICSGTDAGSLQTMLWARLATGAIQLHLVTGSFSWPVLFS